MYISAADNSCSSAAADYSCGSAAADYRAHPELQVACKSSHALLPTCTGTTSTWAQVKNKKLPTWIDRVLLRFFITIDNRFTIVSRIYIHTLRTTEACIHGCLKNKTSGNWHLLHNVHPRGRNHGYHSSDASNERLYSSSSRILCVSATPFRASTICISFLMEGQFWSEKPGWGMCASTSPWRDGGMSHLQRVVIACSLQGTLPKMLNYSWIWYNQDENCKWHMYASWEQTHIHTYVYNQTQNT